MKRYTQHSIRQKKNQSLITDWAYKEGVFLTPNGKWIARVRDRKNLKTISQHETKEQAEYAYNNYHESNSKKA